MRTPAQQAASRTNGAHSRSPNTQDVNPRTSMDALSLNLLARTTALRNESRESFQELVRQHTLRIAPRDAVERNTLDLELATQSSPDDLDRLLRACGALAGRNPLLPALRQPGEKNMSIRTRRGTPRLSRSPSPPARPTVRAGALFHAPPNTYPGPTDVTP